MDRGNSGARDDRALRVGDHADDGSSRHALGVDKWRSDDGQPHGSRRCTHTPQQLRTLHFHTLLRGCLMSLLNDWQFYCAGCNAKEKNKAVGQGVRRPESKRLEPRRAVEMTVLCAGRLLLAELLGLLAKLVGFLEELLL